MDNVSVSEEGIPYVHNLPEKTKGTQKDNSEVITPLVRYAFDIIRKTEFNLPILKYLEIPTQSDPGQFRPEFGGQFRSDFPGACKAYVIGLTISNRSPRASMILKKVLAPGSICPFSIREI